MFLSEAITIIQSRLFGYVGNVKEAWTIVRDAALLSEGQKPPTNKQSTPSSVRCVCGKIIDITTCEDCRRLLSS